MSHYVTLLQQEPSHCHWPLFSVPGMPMPAQHCSHCASPEPELGADLDTSQNPVSDSPPGHCCTLRDAENNTKQTPETLSWPTQRLHTREEWAKQSNKSNSLIVHRVLSSFSIHDDDLQAADSMHKSASLVSNLSVWPHITQCPPLVSSYTVSGPGVAGLHRHRSCRGFKCLRDAVRYVYCILCTDGISSMIPVLEKKRDKTTKIVCLNINIFCQLSRLLDLFIHIACMSLRAGNEPSRSLKFPHYGEGPFVESGYYRFDI